jgi:hypothetical protein
VPHSFPLGGYGYGYAGGAAYGLDASATAADDVAAGYLEVQGEPVTAQVYVDGLYVGTIDDVRRAGRAVDPGAHHVEVRAEGYDSLSVDVRIDPGETTVYRAALKPAASRTAGPPPPPATPKTFYVIPGCYAGTVKPEARQVPSGCDLSKLRTIPPVVTRVASR